MIQSTSRPRRKKARSKTPGFETGVECRTRSVPSPHIHARVSFSLVLLSDARARILSRYCWARYFFEDYFKGALGALVRRALVKSRKTRETPRTRERNATIQARRKDFFVGLFSSMDSTDIQILLLHDVVFVDVRVARRVFSAPNFHQPSSSSARLLSLTPRCVLSFVSSLLFLVSNGLPATLTPRLVL